jgi:hypothetical protein
LAKRTAAHGINATTAACMEAHLVFDNWRSLLLQQRLRFYKHPELLLGTFPCRGNKKRTLDNARDSSGEGGQLRELEVGCLSVKMCNPSKAHAKT